MNEADDAEGKSNTSNVDDDHLTAMDKMFSSMIETKVKKFELLGVMFLKGREVNSTQGPHFYALIGVADLE